LPQVKRVIIEVNATLVEFNIAYELTINHKRQPQWWPQRYGEFFVSREPEVLRFK